jgi:tetratricopeptide (TPR) repeat protein
MTDLPGYSLGDVVDFADGSTGRAAVDRSIAQALQGLEPSDELRALLRLPWRSIFTVNFDDLVEKSFERDRPGQLKVHYVAEDLDEPSGDSIPLYLMHGSIRRVAGRTMGLVITADDFNRAQSHRSAFYHRLTDDMEASEIIYIGFSMNDPDFRRVVDELHRSVDGRQDLIPRGYALLPHPPALARGFWDTKKISLIDTTLEETAVALDQLRRGVAAPPVEIGTRPAMPRFLASIGPDTELAVDLAFSFDFPELDSGDPDPRTFLRGGPASWATIREHHDATREVSDDILAQLVVSPTDEPANPVHGATRFLLITGYGGAGKSTVGKRVAWDLANTWGRNVVWSDNPSRLHFDLIEAAQNRAGGRLYVFIDNGADAALQVVDIIRRARRRGLRISFVVVERANEWLTACRQFPVEPDRRWDVGSLSDAEASALLDELDRAEEIGTLGGLSREEQVRRLTQRANRLLLVAMREATEDARFDDIVVNEYRGLPTEGARLSYLTICTLFQFGVPTRAGVLSRTTGVPFDAFGDEILNPARGVILERGRPGDQPSYVARHRVIAEIVFRRGFVTSRTRAEQVMRILGQLDLGYRDDQRAFRQLISAKWLRQNGVEAGDQRDIYAQAKRLRPGDAMVIQQEALSWRFLDPVQSSVLLKEAAALAPQDDSIQHSQALLLLDEAKRASGEEQNRKFLAADQALRRLIRRDPTNSAPYASLVDLLLAQASIGDEMVSIARTADARGVVDDAFQRCPMNAFLLQAAARVEEAAGALDAAEESYASAVSAAGPQRDIWINYARFAHQHHGPEAAAVILNQALDVNPTEPALNYELARNLVEIGTDDAATRAAFNYAVAEPVRGYLPELDYAIYLHRAGDTGAAEEHFRALRAQDLPYWIKAQAREWLGGVNKSSFTATLKDVGFRSAYVEVPGVSDRVFVDRSLVPSGAKRGDRLVVNVMYNCFGLRAVPVDVTLPEDVPLESDEASEVDVQGN